MGENLIKIRCYKTDYHILYSDFFSFLMECTRILKKLEKRRIRNEKKGIQTKQLQT